MGYIYSDQERETEEHALPNVEVFFNSGNGFNEEDPSPAGFYWQAGFPGCLADGDPVGPFATEAEAIADAQNN